MYCKTCKKQLILSICKMMLINLVVCLFSAFQIKSLECMSTIYQKCMSRPKIIDVNANEPVFYPYSIRINKCIGSCNNINDPFAKLCILDVVKNINVKVFNLMSRINEMRGIVCHETCKCVCRLTEAICNAKQVWNKDKCHCECKEDLINKLVWDKGYISNPSTCSCECDKLCDVGQYLDYKNCVCRKGVVDRMVEDCINIVDGDAIYNETSLVHVNDCPSRTPYVVLLVVFLLTSVIISGVFVYYYRNRFSRGKKLDYVHVDYSMTGKSYY